jgi:hypothetical protein
MNTATKITELPALTADLLQSNSCLVDNLFVCTDLLNPDPEQLLYYFCRWSIGISVCFYSFDWAVFFEYRRKP